MDTYKTRKDARRKNIQIARIISNKSTAFVLPMPDGLSGWISNSSRRQAIKKSKSLGKLRADGAQRG